MPQEFHVVKCYKCEIFQVQIVNKINKYTCKMCGEKQSVKKEYGKGSGKDCRLHVQKLNELYIQNESKLKNIEIYEEVENEMNINNDIEETKSSKWEEYMPNEENNSDNEIENSSEFAHFTFERPNKRKKNLNKTKNSQNKTNSIKSNEVDLNATNFIEVQKNLDENNIIKIKTNKFNPTKKSKWANFVAEEELPVTNSITESSQRQESIIRKEIFKTDDNLDDILNF